MALVVPRRGKAPETARLLLDLADNVRDVQTTTDQGGDLGVAFLIPDELHDRYLEAINQPDSSGGDDKPAAKRRGRGRPRKEVAAPETASADDETEEE